MLVTAIASVTVGVAYIGICIALFYAAGANPKLPNRHLYWLFGTLLFFAGMTRIIENSWGDDSAYTISTLTVAGMVAIPTLWATYRAIPDFLKARPISELVEANMRFRLLVECVRDYAIFLLDPKGNVSTWNAGAERLKGYKPDEILGKHFSVFYLEEDRERGCPQEKLDIAKKDGRYAEEGWRVKKDGTKFWASVTITAVLNDAGELQGFAKVTRDLSERKVAEDEAKKLNQLLNMRMMALEAFNNSVCHDLNAPVRAMEGFTTALLEDFKEQLESQPVMKDYLMRIQKATVRMRGLVRDLMRLAQVSHDDLKASRELFSITEMVWDIVREEKAYPEHQKHKVDVQSWMMADGDPTLVRLLLQNLISNAFKFSSKRSSPAIKVGKRGDEFFVEDNGIGFEQAKADLLFRPFSRLHSAADYPGTGIGLTICKRVIDIHDGSIRAEGRPSEGATFYFTLGSQDKGATHGA